MPTAIPRETKRAPSVTAGSANHIRTGLVGAAGGDTASASSSGRIPQAAATQSPGGSLLRMKWSATAKPAKPTASGTTHHQPTSERDRGQRQGEDREAGGPVGAQPHLHVEQALAASVVADFRQRVRLLQGPCRRGAHGAPILVLAITR